MVIALVVIIVGLLVLGVVLDVRARRGGHKLRSPGDIKAEMRDQRRHLRARREIGYQRTGDDGANGAFSPDREQRLGK